MVAPVITIFVRHSAECKYAGDEFCKRCNCRKHFRWTQNAKQYRRKAGTRSWGEAEQLKHELEDQLSGRAPEKSVSSANRLGSYRRVHPRREGPQRHGGHVQQARLRISTPPGVL